MLWITWIGRLTPLDSVRQRAEDKKLNNNLKHASLSNEHTIFVRLLIKVSSSTPSLIQELKCWNAWLTSAVSCNSSKMFKCICMQTLVITSSGKMRKYQRKPSQLCEPTHLATIFVMVPHTSNYWFLDFQPEQHTDFAERSQACCSPL